MGCFAHGAEVSRNWSRQESRVKRLSFSYSYLSVVIRLKFLLKIVNETHYGFPPRFRIRGAGAKAFQVFLL